MVDVDVGPVSSISRRTPKIAWTSLQAILGVHFSFIGYLKRIRDVVQPTFLPPGARQVSDLSGFFIGFLMALQQILDEIKAEFPDFKLVAKSDSRLMKVIDRFLKIITFGTQKYFMLTYTSTIGCTVYFAKNWANIPDYRKERCLRHERVHMRQAKKWTPFLYAILYLFVPLPVCFAWFRMKFEMEAYTETMRCVCLQEGREALLDPKFKMYVTIQFLEGRYFWMWPFKGYINRWFDKTVKSILENTNNHDR